MQSSEWTPDRLQNRIRDRLRWVAACEVGRISSSPPKPHFLTRQWCKTVLREGFLMVPFAGPVLVKILRGVKARVRRGAFFPWR
jgi:hypothetical protein